MVMLTHPHLHKSWSRDISKWCPDFDGTLSTPRFGPRKMEAVSHRIATKDSFDRRPFRSMRYSHFLIRVVLRAAVDLPCHSVLLGANQNTSAYCRQTALGSILRPKVEKDQSGFLRKIFHQKNLEEVVIFAGCDMEK